MSDIWHVSADSGVSAREFICSLLGSILSENQFYDLLQGNVFPGSVIDCPMLKNPWREYFVDTHNEYAAPSIYESMYGKGSVAAQLIARSKLQVHEKQQREKKSVGADLIAVN